MVTAVGSDTRARTNANMHTRTRARTHTHTHTHTHTRTHTHTHTHTCTCRHARERTHETTRTCFLPQLCSGTFMKFPVRCSGKATSNSALPHPGTLTPTWCTPACAVGARTGPSMTAGSRGLPGGGRGRCQQGTPEPPIALPGGGPGRGQQGAPERVSVLPCRSRETGQDPGVTEVRE
jgi:hypothetical protein